MFWGKGYNPIFQSHIKMLVLNFCSFHFVFFIRYLQQFQYEAEFLRTLAAFISHLSFIP